MIKLEKSYMSADLGLGTETVVYVRLLDEGTEVWRPASAIALGDGSFRIVKPDDYDPETEAWEFPPDSRVKCVRRKFADGGKSLIAIAIAK
jgi:hypothetical protein